ncbi:MAG: Leucyl/phenylalanyl-tRNA--protein transferase [Turneriella sp.]|nr:Leucyl/phenylalanyl-tRNA--protein transferase [Turneriella sp.]
MSLDVKRFTTRYNFPPTSILGNNTVLGIGADLEIDTLLYAYTHGFFPWYEEEPIEWCSPPRRMILKKGEIHISRSLKRHMRKSTRSIRKNTAFADVIRLCGTLRKDTWITPEMEEAYLRLYHTGWAHSWECFDGENLVGGLYGVVIKRAAFLESTFHLQPNAGKEAFLAMYDDLFSEGIELFDFQVPSAIAEAFGGYEVSREIYEIYLTEALR